MPADRARADRASEAGPADPAADRFSGAGPADQSSSGWWRRRREPPGRRRRARRQPLLSASSSPALRFDLAPALRFFHDRDVDHSLADIDEWIAIQADDDTGHRGA